MCEICYKRFTRLDQLRSHLLNHSNQKPFVCAICSKGFTWSQPFSIAYKWKTLHLWSMLQKLQAKRWSKKDNLTHTKEKSFVCKLCLKGFSRNSCLRIHLRTHTNERIFICEICDKRFSQRVNLNEHLQTHMNENPQRDATEDYLDEYQIPDIQ